jgi:hypothetical protein
MYFTAEFFICCIEIFLQSLNNRFEFFVHDLIAPAAVLRGASPWEGGTNWSPRTATRAYFISLPHP